jgi:EmrB/QacA subfamily drug resistance transporter
VATTSAVAKGAKGALVVLAAAQFLMVLDQAVMNVSISQLVEDFDTTVTTIQGVITFYSLVMAALMITGGKVGDIVGRRRAFAIGMVIYGCGSALTAVSWSVPALALGWSVLEGIGAALVLPALAALIAGNFEGASRKMAYGVIGGVAGAGIAVGPILGGWATTELSWRVVFLGEVVVVVGILLSLRWLSDAPREGPAPHLDVVGSVLSALGLTLTVFAVLQSSTWGWVEPKDSPVEPFGFSLTLFVLAGGLGVLWAFVRWQRRREHRNQDPLVDLDILEVPPVRSGLLTFSAQNLILMGVFFVMPLYLQLVLGLDALETGLRLLPTSVMMLLAASIGPRLSRRWSVRSIVRSGIVVLLVATFVLMGAIEPTMQKPQFSLAMGLLGLGLGLIASQLGYVIQSSVTASQRSEAGGLQYTAQQFGSALGVALIGAIVITGLASSFASQIASNPEIDQGVKDSISVQLESGVDFVPASAVEAAAEEAGLDQVDVDAIVDDYEDAQLKALKAGLLAVALIAAASLLVTGRLPAEVEALDERVSTA